MTEQAATLRHDVVERTAEAFVAEVAARTLDGWAISPSNPGDLLYTGTLTVSMYRNDETVQVAKGKLSNIAEKPKLSQAESLAIARAARKAKLDVDNVKD